MLGLRYPRGMHRKILALVLLLTCSLPVRLLHAEPISGLRGMVAAAHPDAAEAGMAMLRAGGTACDAAVAMAFTLAVVEPYSSGIGGGGFALVRHDEKIQFLDFREVAPVRADPNMYMRDGVAAPELSRDGPKSVAVPGAVAGYVTLHQRCGKLPLGRVMAHAIAAAKDGFHVDLRYQKYAVSRADQLRLDPEAARIFLRPDAKGVPQAPKVGVVLKQPELARTLRAIAVGGAKAFYTGHMAEDMVDNLRAKNGLLTVQDLADYRVRDQQPLVGSFRGNLVVTSPPPSSGGQILLTLLNVMETLPEQTRWHDATWLTTFIEASKRAYADRALLGDPEFVPAVNAQLPLLLDKARAKKLAASFAPMKAARDVPAGEGTSIVNPTTPPAPPASERQHTTHLSVLDAAGNAVTMTTTLNYEFGAGVVAGNTGVLWNDEMDDFAVAVGVPNAYGIAGSQANRVARGKIPLSSMAPTLVFAGATEASPLRLVVGSPGGSRIPSTVAQVVLAVLDGGADVRTAANLGRLHHQHMPDEVSVEEWGMDPGTQDALRRQGYAVRQEAPWCNVMAIGIDPVTQVRTAAADPRGVGVALRQ